MNGGLLQSAAGMDLATRIQDLRAQNISNANTIGYRKKLASAEAFSSSLRAAAGLTLPDYKEDIDFTPGLTTLTGEPLDVAVDGDGYFTIETEQGPRYTRNGNFSLDADATLVAFDGQPVLGTSGPIQFDPARGPATINRNGEVFQDGENIGKLSIARFADQRALIPQGDGRFRAAPNVPAEEATDASVLQGYLEQSNVNVVDELVEMIAGFRAFEAAQKAMVSVDRIHAQAVASPQN